MVFRYVPTLLGPITSFRYLMLCTQVFFATHVFSEHVGEVSLTAGPSMMPTLHHTGDCVYINKLARRGRGVRRGDVVTIRHPMFPNERASKRVVGMPGDFVLRDDPDGSSDRMIQVPAGHVWLGGDNVPWSRDSRTYGPVPMALIRGKVVARVFPLSSAGWLRNTLEPVEGR